MLCEECQRNEKKKKRFSTLNSLSGIITQIESLDLDLTIFEFWYVLFDEFESVLINVFRRLLVEDPGFSGRHFEELWECRGSDVVEPARARIGTNCRVRWRRGEEFFLIRHALTWTVSETIPNSDGYYRPVLDKA